MRSKRSAARSSTTSESNFRGPSHDHFFSVDGNRFRCWSVFGRLVPLPILLYLSVIGAFAGAVFGWVVPLSLLILGYQFWGVVALVVWLLDILFIWLFGIAVGSGFANWAGTEGSHASE